MFIYVLLSSCKFVTFVNVIVNVSNHTMLNISFYLLTPKAKKQSLVYVSISNKENRLRFATNESFLTSYCNTRGKKGKELVKKNTPFYYEYTSYLTQVRNQLLKIELDLKKEGATPTLDKIRDTFWMQIGKIKDTSKLPFLETLKSYMFQNENSWSPSYQSIFQTLYNHLEDFEKKEHIKLDLETFNEDTWQSITDYFIKEVKTTNSSTNKNMKKLKQFLLFAGKKGLLKNPIVISDFTQLKTLETFKIALKEHEVDTLLNLDLTDDPRLEKVRDLFVLEVLCGQRYSDVQSVLDKNNHADNMITIYQQKTGDKVSIPIHKRLKKHLDGILAKYPDGLPQLSNQKFNSYLKEVCQRAKFEQIHQWVTLVGNKKIKQHNFRYNLITSHTGRRTFCTLAIKRGMQAELIMKVSGHKKYDQFQEYIHVDDEDVIQEFADKF